MIVRHRPDVAARTYLPVVADDHDVRVFGQAGSVQLLVQPLQKQVLPRQRAGKAQATE